ncbi:MAG TPA: septum site-determining protein MinC [Candidatus Obscuribacterales bacterium]
MSKIAIISQPDQGVLIDVGGCTTMQEAVNHLSSTLQVSSQFWKGVNVALNLGELELTAPQVSHILALAKGVGVYPAQVYAENHLTRHALAEHNIQLGEGKPMTLPAMTICVPEKEEPFEEEEFFEEEPPDSQEQDVSIFYETQEIEEENQVNAPPDKGSFDASPDDAPARLAAANREAPAVRAPQQPTVLYLKQTLRSGQTVSHRGHLVIVGDVNPGAEVMAEGDITVWGALRGIAHAGITGNARSEIRALKLQPIQIRIANAIARSPDRPRINFDSSAGPETARVVDGKIKVFRFNLS